MAQQVYTLLVQLGRKAGDGLPDGATGAALVVFASGVDEAEAVREVIKARQAAGKKSTIVVVAEGARPAGTSPSAERTTSRLRFANLALASGQALADQLHGLGGKVEVAVSVLGHLQRGGDPNVVDRLLASRFGAVAVRTATEGAFGTLVGTDRAGAFHTCPLSEVVEKARTIDPAGDLVWTARTLGISLGADL